MKIRDQEFTLPLLHQKGITNCSSGAISGRTNPKNVRARFYDMYTKCAVTFGSGAVRHYQGTLSSIHPSETVKAWRYRPLSEQKANGSQFIYEKEHIYAYNPSKSTIYSWLKFHWNSNSELHVETSQFPQPIVYRFAHFKIEKKPHKQDKRDSYYLTSLSGPNQPEVSYEYIQNAQKEGWLLSKKSLPEQRFLAIEYYKKGDQPGTALTLPITDPLDPRNNRVKCLKAPVGTNPEPIITHQFFYDLSYKSDQKKKKVTAYHGITTVLDAYKRKTIYYYNERHRLERMIRYQGETPYTITNFLWEENLKEAVKPLKTVIPFDSPHQGNLMGKVIQDGAHNNLSARLFSYDKRGNILKEQFYGNLSGTNDNPLLFDKNQKPIENGVESFQKNFVYRNDPLNLLVEESEPNGKTIIYTYIPDTDLVESKMLCDHNKICVREFYEYDENNALVKVVRDNATPKEKETYERQITHHFPQKIAPIGLPERTDEMVLDRITGQERLIKRTIQKYSPEGKLLNQEVYDASGAYRYTLKWEYDSHGNLIEEANALGETILRKYDDNDNLIEEHGPSADFYTEHTYDYSNRRIKTEIIHRDGTRWTTQFCYDLIGNLIAQIDRHGNETRYQYDDFNRLISTIYPQIQGIEGPIHPIEKKEYDVVDNVIAETDALGFATKKTYNARGKVTSITYPDGQIERYEYDLDGTLTKKIASNGTTSHFTVDCFGRMLSEKIYSSSGTLLEETKQGYDNLHKISVTDASGLTTYFSYNDEGKLAQTTCQDKIEFYAYDALGRLAKKSEPYAQDCIKVTCFDYDLLDRIIEERIEDEQGQVLKKTAYKYDCLGNRTHLIECTQAGISQTITLYNADRKPIRMTDPEGKETHIVYTTTTSCNALEQLVPQTIVTDPIGRQTITIFDAMERPVSIQRIDPFGLLLAHQELMYDARGSLVRQIDHVIVQGKEKQCLETRFAYDARGQLNCQIQAHSLPEQQTVRLSYNKHGQKETLIKPDGTVLTYTYDDLGRVKNYSSSDRSVSYCYKYNVRHQIIQIKDLIQESKTSFDYDAKGKLISEILSNGLKTSFGYDLLNRITKISLPDATKICYSYDALHLRKIERFKDEQVVYTHQYDDFDLAGLNLKATSIYQQEIRSSYDLLKRPLSIETFTHKQTQAQYNHAGHLESFQKDDPVGSINAQFAYDGNDHLISEDSHLKYTYLCDSLHNRLHKNQSTYLINGLHQLQNDGESIYTYDLNGNLICKQNGQEKTTFKYDANNRLIAVCNGSSTTRYLYDALDRRTAQIEGNQTTRYLYAGQDEIGAIDPTGHLQELSVLGLSLGAEIGAAVAIELKGQVYAPSHDFQGNIVGLTNAMGRSVETYRYTAFGEATIYDAQGHQIPTSLVGNPWRFSSKRHDEASGLVYFGKRYYQPGTGRWITADPAGFIDGPNLYAYLHHHPLHSLDRYGLQEETAQTEEPYYPLKNVNYHDGPNQSPPVDDASPNEAPLGFVEKKYGRRIRLFYCGGKQEGSVGIGYVHGIKNTLDDAHASAQTLSEMADNHYVTFQCHQTKGILLDLIRCIGELYFYMETDRVKNLQKQICAWADSTDKGKYYIEAHSEGCIVTRNALRGLPDEYRQRVIVVAFCPGAYISDKYAFEVTHYRSQRDFVPFLDIFGAMRCSHSTITLKCHPNAPWFDHSIDSPTYSDVRQQRVLAFKAQYGETSCVQSVF